MDLAGQSGNWPRQRGESCSRDAHTGCRRAECWINWVSLAGSLGVALNGCQSRGRTFQAKKTAEREAQRCESTQQVGEWWHFGVAAALSSWEHYLKMLELCSEALRGRKEEPSSGPMPTADTSQISAPLPNSQALDEARQECKEESKSQRFEK